MIATINTLLSLATIVGQIGIIVMIICLITNRTSPYRDKAILFGFIVALVSTLGSLFYSEIAGYAPCKLCWFQRIFMYPQTILFAIALWKRDRAIVPYSIALSAIGGIIAVYHYLLQLNIAPALPCSAVGYSVSCSKLFVLQYGYITIPLMAATGFALIFLLMLLTKQHAKQP